MFHMIFNFNLIKIWKYQAYVCNGYKYIQFWLQNKVGYILVSILYIL